MKIDSTRMITLDYRNRPAVCHQIGNSNGIQHTKDKEMIIEFMYKILVQ